MNFELLLVAGSVLGLLAIISILTTVIDGGRPRVASVMVVIAGGLILGAASIAEDGLQLTDVPYAFVKVVAAVLN